MIVTLLMSFICQYCKKSYSRNTNLIKHQKTAKFCLEKQGILPPKPVTPKPVQAKTAAKKRSTTPDANDTTGVTDPEPIARLAIAQVITDGATKLTYQHIKNAESYAKFAAELIKDHVTVSRKVIEYLTENDQEPVKDHTGLDVAKIFFEKIAAANKTVLDTEYRDLQRKVKQIADQGRAGEVDITGLLTDSTKIYDTKMRCDAAAKGEDTEFVREFVKHLHRALASSTCK